MVKLELEWLVVQQKGSFTENPGLGKTTENKFQSIVTVYQHLSGHHVDLNAGVIPYHCHQILHCSLPKPVVNVRLRFMGYSMRLILRASGCLVESEKIIFISS